MALYSFGVFPSFFAPSYYKYIEYGILLSVVVLFVEGLTTVVAFD